MIATGLNMSLAEWIIDDKCFVVLLSNNVEKG